MISSAGVQKPDLSNDIHQSGHGQTPYCLACGSIVEVDEELRGKYLTVGCPMKFSDFKPKITGAPLLGEHTDEALSELGYSAKQIAELHRKKVVGSSGLSRHHHDIIRALQEKGTAHGD